MKPMTGTRVIDSTPAQTKASPAPMAIAPAAMCTACIDEPQNRLTVTAAARSGNPTRKPISSILPSGLAPNTREADWLAIAGKDEKLKNGMERLYRLFKDAPVLGSLINPPFLACDE